MRTATIWGIAQFDNPIVPYDCLWERPIEWPTMSGGIDGIGDTAATPKRVRRVHSESSVGTEVSPNSVVGFDLMESALCNLQSFGFEKSRAERRWILQPKLAAKTL